MEVTNALPHLKTVNTGINNGMIRLGVRELAGELRCSHGTAVPDDLDPDEWDLPPKPKWMRWRTYDRYAQRYDAYEAMLDRGCFASLARLLHK